MGIGSTQAQQQIQAIYAVRNGTALERSGNLEEAIKYYDKALLLEPNDPDLLVMKGDALSHIRNYTGAIKYYDKALAIQPHSEGSTGIMEGIGDDLYHLGKYKEAITSYDKALAVQPNNPDLLINRGNALFHIANYSGAIEYYDKALTVVHNNLQASEGKKLAVTALQKSANNTTK
jgi:tetratricopeptide (TPR) repeat protein